MQAEWEWKEQECTRRERKKKEDFEKRRRIEAKKTEEKNQ